MDKLLNYICDELDELERKAEKNNKLSQTELQYGDMLAHFKKNLLTAEAMMDADDGGSYARGRGRNAKRDSMGRYSSRGYSYDGSYDNMNRYENMSRGSYDDMSYRDGRSYDGYSRDKNSLMSELRDMERSADDNSKHMIRKWIKQLEEQ